MVIQTLAAGRQWRFHDLRYSSSKQVQALAPDLVAGGVVLIAANPEVEPHDLTLLARAVADRRSTIELATRKIPVSPETFLVLVFGCGLAFHRIDASAWIPYRADINEFAPKRC